MLRQLHQPVLRDAVRRADVEDEKSGAGEGISDATARRRLRDGRGIVGTGNLGLRREQLDRLARHRQPGAVHLHLHTHEALQHPQHLGGLRRWRHPAFNGLGRLFRQSGSRRLDLRRPAVRLAVPALQRAVLEPPTGLLACWLPDDGCDEPRLGF